MSEEGKVKAKVKEKLGGENKKMNTKKKLKSNGLVAVATLLVVAVVAVLLVGTASASAPLEKMASEKGVFFDDFSTDSGMWSYVGDAYRDTANEYVVLTENKNWQVGVIWFNQSIESVFTVEFKYKAGGGTGADGLVLIFYKQPDYRPGAGGCLGFSDKNGSSFPGYGIEFDNWHNLDIKDPSANHIALIKDDTWTHLKSIDDARTEDNKWHNVKVVVEESEITVGVDNSTVFTWNGTINRDYEGFGFSGATGSANNWHIIDDVKINRERPLSLAISTDKESYTIGETVLMTLGINRSAESAREMQLELELKEPFDEPDLIYNSGPFWMPAEFEWSATVPFPIPYTFWIPSGEYCFIGTLRDPTTGEEIASDRACFEIDDTPWMKTGEEKLRGSSSGLLELELP